MDAMHPSSHFSRASLFMASCRGLSIRLPGAVSDSTDARSLPLSCSPARLLRLSSLVRKASRATAASRRWGSYQARRVR